MTDAEIQKDFEARRALFLPELNAIMQKYELNLTASDSWTPNTMIRINIGIEDIKKYPEAEVAQPAIPAQAPLENKE